MSKKIPNAEEAFLSNRRNFSSIVNHLCFNGRASVHSEELSLVEDKILNEDAMMLIWPTYIRTVVMHSPKGDIKIVQLGPRRS